MRRAVLARCALSFALASIAAIPMAFAAEPPPLLHEMFQDHAVLQRDRAIAVWGDASAGETVTVELGSARRQARADRAGHWQVELPAMPAGGPHRLVASTAAGRHQVAEDVLVGEVFLCSGQSNMVLQVHRALDSRAELEAARHDDIRMLTVANVTSPVELAHFATPVSWQVATPKTAGEFSAACYFFARELQKSVDVPMGLINASWGGSRIETWISGTALRKMPQFATAVDVLAQHGKQPDAAMRRWLGLWEQWWSQHSDDRPWREGGEPSASWEPAPPGLGAWESWGDPRLAHLDGMLWYRVDFTLTDAQAAQAAMLHLGPIDEVDVTWVNGQGLATSFGYGTPRNYALPAGTLKAGRNLIVVNVLDTYASGGLTGAPDSRSLVLADGTHLPLTGWRFRTTPPNLTPPRAPWDAVAGVSVIGNAMIEPLGRYGIKGVLWYQGESNTGEPQTYRALLGAWMADWRAQFGRDLPFLVVQLANYGTPPTQPVESGWASLREAQRLGVSDDARAGLAIAIDIGDRYDIHPANKQEVARRLARAARKVIYGEKIAPSGPAATAARRDGDAVVVEFGDVERELVAYNAPQAIGFELCGAAAGSCRYATAHPQGQRVRLTGDNAGSATRVRYCWADSPVCTLYDGARLPAGPFEIAIRP